DRWPCALSRRVEWWKYREAVAAGSTARGWAPARGAEEAPEDGRRERALRQARSEAGLEFLAGPVAGAGGCGLSHADVDVHDLRLLLGSLRAGELPLRVAPSRRVVPRDHEGERVARRVRHHGAGHALVEQLGIARMVVLAAPRIGVDGAH